MVLWELLVEELAPVVVCCQYLELIIVAATVQRDGAASPYRSSFIFIATLLASHYEFHLIDEETSSERLNCVLKITFKLIKCWY